MNQKTKRLALPLIAILGLSLSSHAQQEPGTGFTFNHVALSVRDVDRSAEFYRSIFGLQEILNRTEVDGIRWFSLGDGKELHLISVVREPVSLNKAVHFALTTAAFDAFVARLEQGGIEFSSWAGEAHAISVRADDTKQIYVQDPDGYWIEVNSVAAGQAVR